MHRRNMFTATIGPLGLALSAILVTGCGQKTDVIRIGSKNFTEQVILGEMVGQLIEDRTEYKVERTFNLGGTFVCFNALKQGELDVYVEYTGTGLTAILKRDVIADPQEVYKIVSEEFDKQWGLEWLEPLGFNNTYTITMRRSLAESLDVSTISGLAQYSDELTAGFNHEFLERPDGYPGLVEHYGVRFAKKPREMDSGLMYRAVSRGDVDVICGFATDGRIPAFDLVALEDDKGFFPPYYAAPLIRRPPQDSPVVDKNTMQRYDQLRTVLGTLGGQISDAEMRGLNYEVDEERRRAADVAREFLLQKGLIKQTQQEES